MFDSFFERSFCLWIADFVYGCSLVRPTWPNSRGFPAVCCNWVGKELAKKNSIYPVSVLLQILPRLYFYFWRVCYKLTIVIQFFPHPAAASIKTHRHKNGRLATTQVKWRKLNLVERECFHHNSTAGSLLRYRACPNLQHFSRGLDNCQSSIGRHYQALYYATEPVSTLKPMPKVSSLVKRSSKRGFLISFWSKILSLNEQSFFLYIRLQHCQVKDAREAFSLAQQTLYYATGSDSKLSTPLDFIW